MWKYVGVFALCLAACATAPKSTSDRQDLGRDAQAALQDMTNRDPTLPDLLSRAEGYVVFPTIGKGGVIVGAAYGRGVLYERGRPVGYVELNQGSLGAQLGAQTFSELVVFMSRESIERLKRGTFSLGGEISAVALTTGAAAATDFRQDVAVFVKVKGGAMVGISVTGQQLNFDRG
jgi:lipid-binding SYLF domain-containing protein